MGIHQVAFSLLSAHAKFWCWLLCGAGCHRRGYRLSRCHYYISASSYIAAPSTISCTYTLSYRHGTRHLPVPVSTASISSWYIHLQYALSPECFRRSGSARWRWDLRHLGHVPLDTWGYDSIQYFSYHVLMCKLRCPRLMRIALTSSR